MTWGEGLGDPATGVPPASENPKFYALRQRASLFGYNALNPLMLTPKIKAQIASLLNGNEWQFGTTQRRQQSGHARAWSISTRSIPSLRSADGWR